MIGRTAGGHRRRHRLGRRDDGRPGRPHEAKDHRSGLLECLSRLWAPGDARAISRPITTLKTLVEAARLQDPAIAQLFAGLALRRELEEKWGLVEPRNGSAGFHHAGGGAVRAYGFPGDAQPVRDEKTKPPANRSWLPLRICLLGGFRVAWGDALVAHDLWGRSQALAVFRFPLLRR